MANYISKINGTEISALSASYATTASYALTANTAISATSATTANSATNATNATNAVNAQTASLALSISASSANLIDTHSLLLQSTLNNQVVKFPANSFDLTYDASTLRSSNLQAATSSTAVSMSANRINIGNSSQPAGGVAIAGTDQGGTTTVAIGRVNEIRMPSNGVLSIIGGTGVFFSGSGDVSMEAQVGSQTHKIELSEGGLPNNPLSLRAGALYISSSTNINMLGTITSSGTIIPNTSNTRDLGSTTNTWNNIYARNFSAESGYIVIPTATSNPASPKTGSLYYNTSTNRLFIYNGTAWRSSSFA